LSKQVVTNSPTTEARLSLISHNRHSFCKVKRLYTSAYRDTIFLRILMLFYSLL